MKEAGRKSTPTSSVPHSADHLLLLNAVSHLRAVAGSYSMISLPALPVADGVQIVTSSIEELLFADDVDTADLELPGDTHQPAAGPIEADLPNKRRRLMHKQAVVAVAELEAKHLQEQAARKMCFKILNMNPGRIKTIGTFTPKGGRVLSQNDFAVTIHMQHACGPDGALLTDLRPQVCGSGGTHVCLVTDFNPGCSLSTLTDVMHGWSNEGKSSVQYMLPIDGVNPIEVHLTLERFLTHRAVPGQDTGIEVDVRTQPCRALLAGNYIQQAPSSTADSSYQLTSLAMRTLNTGQVHTTSRPLFSPRSHLPLPDLTAFELGMLLRDKQWQWALFPKAIKKRKLLMCDTSAGAATWYTLGKTLVKEYLLCLLSTAHLRETFGVLTFPRYAEKPHRDYARLLQTGAPIEYTEPTEELPRLQDEFHDDEATVVQGAIEDANDDVNDEPEDGNSVEKWMEFIMEQEELNLQAVPEQDDSDDQDIAPAAPAEEEESEHEPQEPDVPEPEPTLPPPPPAPPGTRHGSLRKLPWGCFTIARLRHVQAFEVRCPFHRTKGGHQCRKTVDYDENSESHALMICRWWCNQAVYHNRHASHLGCFSDVWEALFEF